MAFFLFFIFRPEVSQHILVVVFFFSPLCLLTSQETHTHTSRKRKGERESNISRGVVAVVMTTRCNGKQQTQTPVGTTNARRNGT
jgi:hypothetical protein